MMEYIIYKRKMFLLAGLVLWIFVVGAAVLFATYSKQGVSPWRLANMTWFSSYPEPGSEECVAYNGCAWEGLFAGVKGKQTENWVKDHNIAAVHEKFFDQYNGKWLTIRDTGTGKEMNVQVLDKCADSDCNNCCTENMQSTGFLIDLEKYTSERFNDGRAGDSGIIEWKLRSL